MPSILAGADYEHLLRIGDGCWSNVGCTFDIHARLDVGNNVNFGQEVLILTQTHEVGQPARRAAALKSLPVTIGDGAWIGARACILPGVTIGAGAIVGAGALVTHDVPRNVVVGGVPATIIKSLE
jgi:acetyltransferase-like isoleucine patch superfamily enzyme